MTVRRPFFSVILIAIVLVAGCAGDTEKAGQDTSAEPEEEIPLGLTVYWAGTWGTTTGVFSVSLATHQITTLFETELNRVEFAPGDQAFMVVKPDGAIEIRDREGNATATEAVEPASLAPNGRRVLYVRDGALYETAVGGAGSRMLATGAGQAAYGWSMKQIAFTKEDGVYLETPASAATGTPIVTPTGGIAVTNDLDRRAAFAWGRNWVAIPVAVQTGSGQQLMMDLIDTQARTLHTWIANGVSPNWANDERRVAYVSAGQVYVWGLDGETNKQFSFIGDGVTREPKFSNNNAYLLFAVSRDGKPDTLEGMRVRDRRPVPVVTDGDAVVKAFDWERPGICDSANAAPALSAATLVGSATAGTPFTVSLDLTDADCNITASLVFAESEGVKQTVAWELPEDTCATGSATVNLTAEEVGSVTYRFSVEDDCGAASDVAELTVDVQAGDDDTADDDTTDDDTADDDTADDDTTDDDTA